MTHSITQFESALLKMKVDVLNINSPTGNVTNAIGYLPDGKLYIWDENGKCYRGKKSYPEYDIIFIDEYNVSIDQKKVAHFSEMHKFKRPFFSFNVNCSKCSLLKPCLSVHTDDFPFPCMAENRKDKKNGYFLLKR